MNNSFFKAFNPSLNQAAKTMGEKFIVDGSEWDAIAVDELDATTRAELGGRLGDVSSSVVIFRSIAIASGIKQGSKVTVRGVVMRVSDTQDVGDDSITYILGPVGVGTPRK